MITLKNALFVYSEVYFKSNLPEYKMERFQKYPRSNLTFNCPLTANCNMYGASTKYCLIYIKYEMTRENAIGQTTQNNPPALPQPGSCSNNCKHPV